MKHKIVNLSDAVKILFSGKVRKFKQKNNRTLFIRNIEEKNVISAIKLGKKSEPLSVSVDLKSTINYEDSQFVKTLRESILNVSFNDKQIELNNKADIIDKRKVLKELDKLGLSDYNYRRIKGDIEICVDRQNICNTTSISVRGVREGRLRNIAKLTLTKDLGFSISYIIELKGIVKYHKEIKNGIRFFVKINADTQDELICKVIECNNSIVDYCERVIEELILYSKDSELSCQLGTQSGLLELIKRINRELNFNDGVATPVWLDSEQAQFGVKNVRF